ncbi:hypothetical protein EVAR_3240_1 [Eumeta japonica]|uniref:Uncharacterized protein n=1 Tax=Eumeta variegata TaxID=151549 RepID=A0A4C1SUQ5_EUMVA|nr:hypothetical protein EVAR_3240_1 [Eumeta japonica]
MTSSYVKRLFARLMIKSSNSYVSGSAPTTAYRYPLQSFYDFGLRAAGRGERCTTNLTFVIRVAGNGVTLTPLPLLYTGERCE